MLLSEFRKKIMGMEAVPCIAHCKRCGVGIPYFSGWILVEDIPRGSLIACNSTCACKIRHKFGVYDRMEKAA